MTAATAPAVPAVERRLRPPSSATRSAFLAMLGRDFVVMRKRLVEFLVTVGVQPFLVIFVFTYVFPKIGQSVGGGYVADQFSTLVSAGMVAFTTLSQGMLRVGAPLVQEFGVTREIEDRVLAPMPVSMVALEKITFGAIQSFLAGCVVLPIAWLVPLTHVSIEPNLPVLLTVVPLACFAAAGFGLTIGTAFNPRSLPMLTSAVILPMSFGGAVFYTWGQLVEIPWMQRLVLINPLVYISEGSRAALVAGVYHMHLVVIYGALAGFVAVFTPLGIRGFKRRALS